MRSIEVLRREHQHILRALGVLDVLARSAERGDPVPSGPVAALVDFFAGFAAVRHHAKEEEGLFPALEARGFPRHGGPLVVMLMEHDDGRALLRALDRSAADAGGTADARARFAAAARAYGDLVREHVQKEDEILLPLAERALDDDDDARIGEVFARHDADGGEGEHLLGAAMDLARIYL
jgi:hemerythrin-like domain-containing protein